MRARLIRPRVRRTQLSDCPHIRLAQGRRAARGSAQLLLWTLGGSPFGLTFDATIIAVDRFSKPLQPTGSVRSTPVPQKAAASAT
jgi:hypothetical protein